MTTFVSLYSEPTEDALAMVDKYHREIFNVDNFVQNRYCVQRSHTDLDAAIADAKDKGVTLIIASQDIIKPLKAKHKLKDSEIKFCCADNPALNELTIELAIFLQMGTARYEITRKN